MKGWHIPFRQNEFGEWLPILNKKKTYSMSENLKSQYYKRAWAIWISNVPIRPSVHAGLSIDNQHRVNRPLNEGHRPVDCSAFIHSFIVDNMMTLATTTNHLKRLLVYIYIYYPHIIAYRRARGGGPVQGKLHSLPIIVHNKKK